MIFVGHCTMTNKGILNLSLFPFSHCRPPLPFLCLSPALLPFPTHPPLGSPWCCRRLGGPDLSPWPLRWLCCSSAAGSRRAGSRYEPQTFPFSPSQHKSVYRVGGGWGGGGEGGGSCCMRVLRPLRVCVCASVFVCALDPVALQSSISVCLLIWLIVLGKLGLVMRTGAGYTLHPCPCPPPSFPFSPTPCHCFSQLVIFLLFSCPLYIRIIILSFQIWKQSGDKIFCMNLKFKICYLLLDCGHCVSQTLEIAPQSVGGEKRSGFFCLLLKPAHWSVHMCVY